MDWQPIDTAPKDGTTVLVGAADKIAMAFWWDGNFQNPAGWRTGNGLVYPTQWMPLPDPPKAGERPARDA